MAEDYTLTTPETTPATVTAKYRVTFLQFEWTAGAIVIHLVGDHGERIYTGYGGKEATDAERQEAITMMKALNTANLSVKSLQKRVLEKLSADGKLPPGSVTGTPDA